MPERAVTLRDPSGVEHRLVIDAGHVVAAGETFRIREEDGALLLTTESGRTTRAWAVRAGATCWVFADGAVLTFEIVAPGARRRPGAGARDALGAPMPATVRAIAVEVGTRVEAGDVLVVLEAMKMELPVRAPAAGVVTAVKCRAGDLVQSGQELVEVTP